MCLTVPIRLLQNLSSEPWWHYHANSTSDSLAGMAIGDAELATMCCKRLAIGSWLSVRTRIVRKLAEAGGIVRCNRLSRHTTIWLDMPPERQSLPRREAVPVPINWLKVVATASGQQWNLPSPCSRSRLPSFARMANQNSFPASNPDSVSLATGYPLNCSRKKREGFAKPR